MGYEQVDDLCARRFFYFVLLVGLTQCTGDKTVTGVGESCLAIFFQEGFDLGDIAVALLDDRFGTGHRLHERFHLRVAFKQLDGEVAFGKAFGYVPVQLQSMPYRVDGLFQYIAVVDMDMAEHGIFFFVHLYDAVEKVFDTETSLADGRDDRRTDHP